MLKLSSNDIFCIPIAKTGICVYFTADGFFQNCFAKYPRTYFHKILHIVNKYIFWCFRLQLLGNKIRFCVGSNTFWDTLSI